MALLVPTSPLVVPGSGARFWRALAGEPIEAGEPVYLSARTGQFYRAWSLGDAVAAAVIGLAANVADYPGQPLQVQISGDMILPATPALVPGGLYVLGEHPGTLIAAVELAFGDYVTLLGIADAANLFHLGIFPSGVRYGLFLHFDYWKLIDEEATVWYVWFNETGGYSTSQSPPDSYRGLVPTALLSGLGTPASAIVTLDASIISWYLTIDTLGQLGYEDTTPSYGTPYVALTGLPALGADSLTHAFFPETDGRLIIATL